MIDRADKADKVGKTGKKFYVTTPIYYVTARPHLGSLYSTLIADVLKRWHMLQGAQSFFLTGTDEHGQKIAQAAQIAGKEPKAFVDSFIPAYQEVWKQYNLDYDHFIRTTDPQHMAGVQHFIRKLIASGDIYKDSYQGWYCTPCETFVTKKDLDLASVESAAPSCPSCNRATQAVEEETYFFRLSAYQDKLLAFYKTHPDFFMPRQRGQEVVSFVEGGLTDLSLSRTTVKWGIPFPDDAKHTVYVWADALTNYMTAVGYGPIMDTEQFAKWWPADVHVVGKDIVRFHAVYWIAFLMAAELPLPKHLLVHGWIKMGAQKMSKSLGNVIDPVVLHDAYGTDAVRYYLLRRIAITQDGEFSIADLEQCITSELANDLGNLVQRIIKLALRYELSEVTPPESWSSAAVHLRDSAYSMINLYEASMACGEFHMALAELWKFINQVNAYVHKQEPWKVIKTDKHAFAEIVSATCHSLRIIGILVWPIMPNKALSLLYALGIQFKPGADNLRELELDIWHHAFRLTDIDPLFLKIEPKPELNPELNLEGSAMDPKVIKSVGQVKPIQEVQAPVIGTIGAIDAIGIEEFAKVSLQIGTITGCERVPNSDKLLKLSVDLGEGNLRQILSGIAQFFEPNSLIGTQAVFVTNLKPRKMMGLESHGMLLTATKSTGGLTVITVPVPVPNGTPLR